MNYLNAIANLQIPRCDWKAIEKPLIEKLALAPEDFDTNLDYGNFLIKMGRPREAIEYFQRAGRAAEPNPFIVAEVLTFAHVMMGDYDKALEDFEQFKQLMVRDNPAVLDPIKCLLAIEMSDRELLEASLGSNSTMRTLLDSPEKAREVLHREVENLDISKSNQSYESSSLSLWASYFGDYELTLKLLYLQYLRPKPVVDGFAYNPWPPVYKGMRQLSGFKELVRNIGLVDYWRETGKWNDFCRPVGDDDFECE